MLTIRKCFHYFNYSGNKLSDCNTVSARGLRLVVSGTLCTKYNIFSSKISETGVLSQRCPEFLCNIVPIRNYSPDNDDVWWSGGVFISVYPTSWLPTLVTCVLEMHVFESWWRRPTP